MPSFSTVRKGEFTGICRIPKKFGPQATASATTGTSRWQQFFFVKSGQSDEHHRFHKEGRGGFIRPDCKSILGGKWLFSTWSSTSIVSPIALRPPLPNTPPMNLDPVQASAANQFGQQSHRYGKGHILADVSDVVSALEQINPLPAPLQVLDVATGAGHTGLHLAELGHDVTCADIAQPMLDRVKEAAQERSLNVRTQLHPAELFPHADESFDLVTCRVAAHHFSSPDQFVSESARVLKPGGHLLLIDGSIEDGQPVAEDWIDQVEKLRDPSHHRFLSPSHWQSVCGNSSLATIHCRLDPFKMPDLNWYFETANTSADNRQQVLERVRHAPNQAREQFGIAEENGAIVWWWRRLTLVARK